MTVVSFHPSAGEELLEATEWYLKRSQSAAVGFVREVDQALARIAEAPERYPVTKFGTRRFVLATYPYDVVYRIVSEAVQVMAVAHHARKPGYWRRR